MSEDRKPSPPFKTTAEEDYAVRLVTEGYARKDAAAFVVASRVGPDSDAYQSKEWGGDYEIPLAPQPEPEVEPYGAVPLLDPETSTGKAGKH